MKVRSGDAEIFYDVLGKGPDVVLLHPFPANSDVWRPAAESLALRYRLILPDLRGHGQSTAGKGPATMDKHSADVARVCDDAGVGRSVFVGVSIGGYILFEFWRQHRERVVALGLCDTRAGADSDEARANRINAADEVERHGPQPFIDAQIPRLLGSTTLATRPDLVQSAREMMGKMSAQGIAAVQRGMAARPDATTVLKSIVVPTLLMFGEEDGLTTPDEGSRIQQQIHGSSLRVIPRAGHYAVFERHGDAVNILRAWLDSLPRW